MLYFSQSSKENSRPNLNPATTISEADLPAYRQAATELGIELFEAPQGEPYSVSPAGKPLIAEKGFIGINIHAKYENLPADGTRYDYTKFSRRVGEIISKQQTKPTGYFLVSETAVENLLAERAKDSQSPPTDLEVVARSGQTAKVPGIDGTVNVQEGEILVTVTPRQI
jgi:hypothetical protein